MIIIIIIIIMLITWGCEHMTIGHCLTNIQFDCEL